MLPYFMLLPTCSRLYSVVAQDIFVLPNSPYSVVQQQLPYLWNYSFFKYTVFKSGTKYVFSKGPAFRSVQYLTDDNIVNHDPESVFYLYQNDLKRNNHSLILR